MNLYLIRHGRTTHNETGQVAPLSSPLSDLGINQAMNVAQRLKDTHFDKIFSSDLARAKDTASYIAKQHNMDVVTSALIREHKKPSEMEGLAHDSEEAQRIYKIIEDNMEDPAWHYSDDENYYDFRGRLIKFMQEVEKEKGENILAVSHSLVIRLLVCLTILGRDLKASHFQVARWRMRAMNTGVTVLEYDKGEWSLLTFNDIAHLAE